MKKYVIILFAAALALCSCQKSPVEQFSGRYSFKTGGELDLKTRVLDLDWGGLKMKDTIIRRAIVPESGQMRIVSDSGNRVVVTMNVTAGNLVVIPATVSGNDIILDPVSRKILVCRETGLLLWEEVPVIVSGIGRKMDNSVIIDLEFEGEFNLGVFPCEVVASNVNCVANKNE